MKLPLRFSLRTLAYSLTLLCLALGVPIGYIRYNAERQRQTIARLYELGVSVDFQKEAKPTQFLLTLRNWIDPDALRKVHAVSFRPGPDNPDEAVRLLSKLDDLKNVFSQSPHFNDSHFASIANISTLTQLVAEKGTCSPTTAKLFLRNSQWERLMLAEVRFDDEMLAELANMKSLIAICFDASMASSKGLESLGKSPSLQDIFLYRPQHPGGIAKAIRQIRTIKTVMILNATIDANDLAEFGDIGALRWLQFYDCKVDSAKIDRLARAKTLKTLEFFNTPVSPAVLDVIQGFPALTILGLDSCLDDSNVADLANCPALKMLGLSKTNLTDEGLQQLAKVRTLGSLLLPANTLCTEAGIRRLQEKSAIRVVVGPTNNGIHYLPGGKTDDRRKKPDPSKTLAK